jgi:hypothetical protein
VLLSDPSRVHVFDDGQGFIFCKGDFTDQKSKIDKKQYCITTNNLPDTIKYLPDKINK